MGSLYTELNSPFLYRAGGMDTMLVAVFFLARKKSVRGMIQQKYFVAVRSATTTLVLFNACVDGEGETDQPLPSAFPQQALQDKVVLNRGGVTIGTV